jgi:excinuclease ABC subunit C
LNSVPGIGAKRRRALIRHFSSVERIKQASIDELQAAPSMSKSAAEAVFGFFHPMEE